MGLHHHHHHHHHKKNAGTKNVATAFFINLVFTLIEFGGGLYTNSMAILSDSLHDLGDSISLGMAWYFEKLSLKKANNQYTYGYGRFSVLGAAINSLILIAGSIFIFIHALERLKEPQDVVAPGMFILAVLGVIFNGAAIFQINNKGSLNERVIYYHLMEDVLGWVLVLVSSLAIHFLGWLFLDALLSLLISIYIVFNAIKTLYEAVEIFLQKSPKHIDLETVSSKLEALPEVSDIHDLHLWGMDTEDLILSMHCRLTSSAHDLNSLLALKARMLEELHAMGLKHATIEFEAPNESCNTHNFTS